MTDVRLDVEAIEIHIEVEPRLAGSDEHRPRRASPPDGKPGRIPLGARLGLQRQPAHAFLLTLTRQR
jgi:hypothetical protein